MTDYEGLVALVTGGASGIGAETARLLTSRGARVAVLDLSQGDPAHSADVALHVACDVADPGSVSIAVEHAAAELGGIDVLVNNAGISAVGDVSSNSDEEWHRVLDVNVVGVARVSRAALPHLRRSDHAAVVNTSSIVAAIGVPDRALYGASKGAVLALTLAMAADHARDGIRVNAVLPATTDTPWLGRLLASAPDPELALAQLKARQPLGRLVSASEVAHAIAYLAGPQSGSTTGTALTVDGGMTGFQLPR